MRRPFAAAMVVMLAGAASAATEKTRVIALEIAVLDTSAPGQEADSIKRLALIAGERVSAELGATGQFEVLSSADLSLVLGLERQKQLLGCGDTGSSCLAELSGALGAPLLISGSLSRAGGKMRLDLKLVRTKDAKVLSRQGAFLASEGEVFTAVPPMVQAIADVVAGKEPMPVVPVSAPCRSVPALVVAGAGVLAVGGGVALWVHQSVGAETLQRDLSGGELVLSEAEQRREGIYAERAVGLTMISAGAAVAVGGVVWFLLSGGEAKSVAALVPLENGALLSWSGSW